MQNTVFVGALHGMLNAEGLAHIFNDLFGGVVYAGIDTDKVINSCHADFPVYGTFPWFSNDKSSPKDWISQKNLQNFIGSMKYIEGPFIWVLDSVKL